MPQHIITLILLCFIGIIICCGFVYYKIKTKNLIWYNLKQEIEQLEADRAQVLTEKQNNYIVNESLKKEIASNQSVIDAKKQQYQQMEIAEAAVRDRMKSERDLWFEEYKKSQEVALKDAASDFIQSFNSETSMKLETGEKIAAEVAQLRKTAQAAIEVAKVREADRTAKDFYRLQVDPSTLDDIRKLRDVMKELKRPEVLGKLIWKVYYERPYTDLCGRLFSKPVMGIYLITNLENDMCYVGQAVNVQDRWRQHIKRALGAETPTQNKLYPAMAQFGVENFTFQLIEEVSDRFKLDEREDYWQDFYRAKEFGYSIK